MQFLSEQNIMLFLVQVFILLGCARGLGELFRRWKQPALTAEILVGVVLGPTLFGRYFPQLHSIIFPVDPIQQSMLMTVSWLGVLFLLLEIGLEIDFSSAWRQQGDALKIALTDIIVPMAIAFLPIYFLPSRYLINPDQRLIFTFFMITVMAITALPTVARALHDLKLSKTDLGFLIMSALSVNDIIGWLIFTIVLGFFTQANLAFGKIVFLLSAAIGFTVLCLTVGRTFANYTISKIREKQMPEPASSLTFICLLGLACGAITQKIGIHALFGFFIAGVMAGEAKALSERTRQVISQMVYAVFVPLFFASIGLKIDFVKNFDLFLVLIVTVVGTFGRFFGTWIGVSIAKLPKVNRLTVAISHIPGGAIQVVVGVLALEHNLISEPVFEAIVFGAIISTVILGPLLDYSIRKRKEVSLLEYFSRRAVIGELKTDERDAAIRELCEKAAFEESIGDVDSLFKTVLVRENDMGTAIEDEIAIPHARVDFIQRPVIIFGRSPEGIEWDSPDGKPTHFIFLILVPKDDDVQVQILAAIARSMSDEKARDAIMRAKEDLGIWKVLQKLFTTRHIVRK